MKNDGKTKQLSAFGIIFIEFVYFAYRLSSLYFSLSIGMLPIQAISFMTAQLKSNYCH